eukprot:9282962-Heterocapsa_arctica.AAC.1
MSKFLMRKGPESRCPPGGSGRPPSYAGLTRRRRAAVLHSVRLLRLEPESRVLHVDEDGVAVRPARVVEP